MAFLIALLLLAAAGLKAYSIFFDAFSRQTFFTTRRMLIAVVEAELVLAVWLLSGRSRSICWIATLGFFCLLTAVSAHEALSGIQTCGCFGPLALNTWWSVGLDSLVVVVLVFSRPQRDRTFLAPTGSVALTNEHRSFWLQFVWLGVGSCILMLGLVLTMASSPTKRLVTSVTLDQTFFDFGEAPQNEELTHMFQLRNNFESPIQVTQVHSTCGCTTLETITGQFLGSNQSLDLPVTLSTGDSDGPRSATVTIFYRAVGQLPIAWKSLQIQAHVITNYSLSSRFVDFGSLSDGQVANRIIELHPRGLPNVRVTRIDCSDDVFSAHLREDTAHKGPEIELSFAPAQRTESQRFAGVLRVHTSSRRTPIALVALSAEYRAEFQVTPSTLIVGTDVDGPARRNICLHTANPALISAKSCQNERLRVLGVVSHSLHDHQIEVEITGGSAHSTYMGDIELQIEPSPSPSFGNPEIRIIRIPAFRLCNHERSVGL